MRFTPIPNARVAVALLVLSACFDAGGRPSFLTPIELQGMLANDFAGVIDVREADQVRVGMVRGAYWFPASRFDSDRDGLESLAKRIGKSRQIVFYGASEPQALRVAEWLSARGFKTAVMQKGYTDWRMAALPTQAGPSPLPSPTPGGP